MPAAISAEQLQRIVEIDPDLAEHVIERDPGTARLAAVNPDASADRVAGLVVAGIHSQDIVLAAGVSGLAERVFAAGRACLPDTLARAGSDPLPSTRAVVAANLRTPSGTLTELAADDDPAVRLAAVSNIFLPEGVARRMIIDPDPVVARRARQRLETLDLIDAYRGEASPAALKDSFETRYRASNGADFRFRLAWNHIDGGRVHVLDGIDARSGRFGGQDIHLYGINTPEPWICWTRR